MQLKRKRSDSEISNCSGSMFSSPPQSSATPYTSQFTHQVTPLHLSSRTRKRVRDNRPSEDMIHKNTLNMLFEAQRHPQPVPVHSNTPITPTCGNIQAQQASLHSFWALPARSTSHDSSNISESSLSIPITLQETRCDDCDAVLINGDGDGDAMDLDIDVDVYGGSSDFSCSQCRKPVCHQCAVSNLGQQRQCLTCAGRRQWVGGLGWVNA